MRGIKLFHGFCGFIFVSGYILDVQVFKDIEI